MNIKAKVLITCGNPECLYQYINDDGGFPLSDVHFPNGTCCKNCDPKFEKCKTSTVALKCSGCNTTTDATDLHCINCCPHDDCHEECHQNDGSCHDDCRSPDYETECDECSQPAFLCETCAKTSDLEIKCEVCEGGESGTYIHSKCIVDYMARQVATIKEKEASG